MSQGTMSILRIFILTEGIYLLTLFKQEIGIRKQEFTDRINSWIQQEKYQASVI